MLTRRGFQRQTLSTAPLILSANGKYQYTALCGADEVLRMIEMWSTVISKGLQEKYFCFEISLGNL